MEKPSQSEKIDQLDTRIDRVLNKYVTVWVWSILFGAAMGAALTLVNYRIFGEWRELGLILSIFMAAAGLTSLLSLRYLIQFLGIILIPTFFDLPARERQYEEMGHFGAFLLKRAVMFLFLSFMLGIMVVILQLLFSALRYF